MLLLLACTQPGVVTDSQDTAPTDSVPRFDLVPEDEPETPPAFPTVDLFSDTDIHPMNLELSSSARSSLRSNPDRWVEAVLVVEGVEWPVGVRIKGTSTQQSVDGKPSLKVAFDYVDEGLRFDGMRRVNLHNQILDPILSSEWLQWGLFRKADLPAPRVGYARLDINDDDRGLYTIVEDIETDFLKRWFDDPKGNLYENAQNYCDFTRVSCFDVEEDDEGNNDALERLIASAPLTGSEWNAAMTDQMDWERYTGFLAMERTIAHWDSYSFDLSNYRVYHDPTADKWAFIPWSGDLGFGYRPWSYPDCGKHGADPAAYDMGLLASGCENDPQCASDVMDKMLEYADLIETVGGGDYVRTALARVRAEAATDPDHRNEMDHFDEHGACVAEFLDTRPDWVRDWVSENR